MDIEPVKQEITQIKEQLLKANAAYFNEDREIIPESIRDQLKARLIQLEAQSPELITPDSPTQRVGAPLSGKLPKVPHTQKKYSLQDAFSAEDLREFDTQVKKFLKKDQVSYSCELKLDGLNITLWYRDGKFTKALTRGDGETGEDVTHTVRTISNLPLSLSQPLNIEATGEVFIYKDDFERINSGESDEDRFLSSTSLFSLAEELESRGLPEPNDSISNGSLKRKRIVTSKHFKNARNLAAGTVRQLDPQVAADRNLQINLYTLDLVSSSNNQAERLPKTQSDLLAFFKTHQLPHNPTISVYDDIEAVIDFCQAWHDVSKRHDLNYDIDGIVVKVHDFDLRSRLGYTAKTAKYAIAYKFPAEEKYTTLQAIEYQVGRTGAITPVAHLTPIDIAGSTVARATLHNAGEIERKGLKIGDKVIIRKAGDIIPEIVEPLIDLRDGSETNIVFPGKCPRCGNLLNQREIVARCENPDCPAKIQARLIYFSDTLDIEGLGKSTVESLIDLGFVQSPADFWALTADQLSQVPLFKTKKIHKLLQALQSAKNIEIHTLVSALGIRLVGRENAKLISDFIRQNYGEICMQDLYEKSLFVDESSQKQLVEVDGIGEKVAQSFIDFFVSREALELFETFDQNGVEISWPEAINEQQIYSNIKFVITGSFEALSRDEIKKKIIDLGGKIQSSVSSQTNILVCGEKPGSKRKKAEELGIEIWDEKRLLEELGGGDKISNKSLSLF